MSVGLPKTWEILATSGNDFAVEVLAGALDSPYRTIQTAALHALLERRSEAGNAHLLRRWNRLEDDLRQRVVQCAPRLHVSLRSALLGTDPVLFANACEALLWVKQYELLPTLITVAEDRNSPRGDEAARQVVLLADAFHDDTTRGQPLANGSDPRWTRQLLVACLEQSMLRWSHHQRPELLHAFLILTGTENTTLRRMLQGSPSRYDPPALTMLAETERPGAIRLLLAFLDDTHAPPHSLGVLAQRTDDVFLRLLLKKVGHDPSAQTKAHLRRVESIAWLRADLRRLQQLTDIEQQAALQIALASGMARTHVYEVVQLMLRGGKPGARQMAAQALAEFRGADANILALHSLADPDPTVQVNILTHLRERGIPSAMGRLLEMIDSPHDVVRQAAQHCLGEFNFKRYLTAFDMLAPHVRISTGQLVCKVDPDTIPQLKTELFAAARTRRFRALQIIYALSLANDLEAELIELLHDEDHFLRIEAAQLLAKCDTQPTRHALRDAMLDRNTGVQDAAERSLRQLAEQSRLATLPLLPVTEAAP